MIFHRLKISLFFVSRGSGEETRVRNLFCGGRRLLLALLIAVFPFVSFVDLSAGPPLRGALMLPEGGEVAGREQAIHWQNFFRAHNTTLELIAPADLERHLVSSHQLLVIDDVVALTNAQQQAVVDFIRRGNIVILTMEAGAVPAAAGQRSLTDQLGLKLKKIPDEASSSWWIVMDRPCPLSAGIPRMQRISVQAARPIAAEVSGFPVAFWLPGGAGKPDYEALAANAGIVTGSLGEGRFLWLGFSPNDVGGDLESNDAFHRLMANALDYLQGRPTIEVATWPHPHTTTAIFSMDVEERFGNIRRVHELEEMQSITYFILSRAAGLHESLLQEMALSSAGTVSGREIAVHGDNHDVFRGQPAEKQRERLARARDYVTTVTGEAPIGFRPPEEAYDFYTLQSLVKNGFRYIVGNHTPDRAEPRFLQVGEDRLVQLAMLNRDDVNLVVQAAHPSPDEVLDGYLHDMETIFRREGLYILNFHSQILATADYVPILRDLLAFASTQGAWVANCREIYSWWLQREKIHLEVIEQAAGGLHFRVANTGAEAVEDVAVHLWLPAGAGVVRIESPPGGRRVLDFQSDPARVRIRVPLLLPGDAREYLLQWRE